MGFFLPRLMCHSVGGTGINPGLSLLFIEELCDAINLMVNLLIIKNDLHLSTAVIPTKCPFWLMTEGHFKNLHSPKSGGNIFLVIYLQCLKNVENTTLTITSQFLTLCSILLAALFHL